MGALCRVLERSIEALAAAMVATFAVVIFADVVCRYWLHIPLPWVSEFTVLLFQLTAFCGAAIALRRGMHFGLGMLVERSWPALKRPIALLVALIVSATALTLAVLALQMTRQTWDATYATLGISHAWAYVGVMASAVLMTLFGVESAVSAMRKEPKDTVH